MPWRSSTSCATSVTAAARLSWEPRGPAYSQPRSSRSWARARRATSAGSSALRWIRARVCRTESCRWAAMSARSVSRTRSACSSRKVCQSRTAQGAAISTGAREHRDRRDARRPRGPQPPALRGEDDDAHGGEGDAEPEPHHALAPGGPDPGEPPVALGAVELGPGEDRPDGDGQQRDEHPEAQVEPGLLGEQPDAEDHQGGADRELAQGLAGHPAAAEHRHRGAPGRARGGRGSGTASVCGVRPTGTGRPRCRRRRGRWRR